MSDSETASKDGQELVETYMPDLIGADEAARLLNIPPSTLRDWASRGIGPPFYRLGPRHLKWDRRAIPVFLEERRSDVGS